MAGSKTFLALAILLVALGAESRRPPPRAKQPPSPSPRPPRPPPPPVPSPPPALFEYPHSCKPGNIKPLGQGAGIDCTPYVVEKKSVINGNYTFIIKTHPVSTKCGVSSQACMSMNLGDVKFAINSTCRGSVDRIWVRNPDGTGYGRSPSYASEQYAIAKKPGMTVRVVFPNAYTVANADGLEFSFTLKSYGCTYDQLFNTGFGFRGAQYGYYPKDNKKCCGTAIAY
mmetsp:Transcript_11565/g.28317  ORF Transcript_11565/g.28317 Transcript_11565/m.28317 type:complete len:227 (-) Transcript_11565:1616-2296(-)|eukprot:CAMPEP_0202885088 /NCGR_PEP_ID=MMETSP1391-20130828/41484_1 /ASSEMBLY_ACC=CAM_ASM_000867 /TAXON_ID=1034604 /ORGANISM="Chlamydomonas leiostraca, Strain SAG 11-49" /LENGTH=226 /DNA_ID=CAMNT_0049568327 /DNA_START=68 /DNA_END=748 /DNA_ORIENTATION=+